MVTHPVCNQFREQRCTINTHSLIQSTLGHSLAVYQHTANRMYISIISCKTSCTEYLYTSINQLMIGALRTYLIGQCIKCLVAIDKQMFTIAHIMWFPYLHDSMREHSLI